MFLTTTKGDKMMDLEKVSVKLLKLNEFQSNVGHVAKQLEAHEFKDIRLTCTPKILELSAKYRGELIILELGSENIYLKYTPFHSKNADKFISAIKQLIEVD